MDMGKIEVTEVVIVGAGPSGLATSACLKKHSIPHIILEKDDCTVSLWRKHTYDRVNLHLAKEFCSLPLMPHSPSSPRFLTKTEFLNYIDNYVSHFNICPRYCRMVDSAAFDEAEKKWRIETTNTEEGGFRREVYMAKYLVVASGENSEGYIPEFNGLDSFEGEIIHSKNYKNGCEYKGKEVLVIGCGKIFEVLSCFIFYLVRIKRIEKEKKKVIFKNNVEKDFDVIMFATGFKSVANNLL